MADGLRDRHSSGDAAREADADRGALPSQWVRRWSHLVASGGTVLDVACGGGRHARWFASRGHPVVALDRDDAALASLADVTGVRVVHADLEPSGDTAAWPFGADERFAAIIVTNYLHRPLLPQLTSALAPGGVWIHETFAQGNETLGRPSNPRFLLRPGELLDAAAAAAMRVVAFEDGFVDEPRPAFVQRICAVRDTEQEMSGDKTGTVTAPPKYDLRAQSATISL
jgi:SAM-dependent methyltransferase